ncbi:MAG: hypothetical protein WBE01_05340 [Methyloceanibacter sp.]|jgi:hypothetical protein
MDVTKPGDGATASEAETLRRFADMLCLWRLCGNAGCRRARSCRGRVHLCARRNTAALPAGVRGLFIAFLAAKHAGLSFDMFVAEMDGGEEHEAFAAWVAAARDRRPRGAGKGGMA